MTDFVCFPMNARSQIDASVVRAANQELAAVAYAVRTGYTGLVGVQRRSGDTRVVVCDPGAYA